MKNILSICILALLSNSTLAEENPSSLSEHNAALASVTDGSDLCTISAQPTLSDSEAIDMVVCAHGDGSVTSYFVVSNMTVTEVTKNPVN